MTNSERITSHNALIDEAIAKANALPDAGSGGGGVETCTVHYRFGNDGNRRGNQLEIFATKNGAYHSYYITLISTTNITCNDQSVSFENDKYGTKHPVFEVDKGTAVFICDPTLEGSDLSDALCVTGCSVEKMFERLGCLVVAENDECILGWSWNI